MITLGQTLGDLSLVLNSVRDGGPNRDDEDEDGASAGLDLAATNPLVSRPMTIDSDVTSLLQRQLAKDPGTEMTATKGDRPVPLPDRTTKVQVVRGVVSRAVQLGLEAATDPATPVETAPAPAAE
jgi:hypothetical protein